MAASELLPPLGQEEQELHDDLIATAVAVRALIPGLVQRGTAPTTKASAHLLEKQIQDKLAHLRCTIRDLELLAEEQDT
jgi:hypothetical protein